MFFDYTIIIKGISISTVDKSNCLVESFDLKTINFQGDTKVFIQIDTTSVYPYVILKMKHICMFSIRISNCG